MCSWVFLGVLGCFGVFLGKSMDRCEMDAVSENDMKYIKRKESIHRKTTTIRRVRVFISIC